SEPLQKDLELYAVRLGGLLGLTLILALGIGRILANRTLRPILTLTAAVEGLGKSDYRQRIPASEGSREIAELSHSFSLMALNIENRLWQMETIRGLHSRMNESRPRKELLEYVLASLCEKFQLKFAALGFFHGPILDHSSDWLILG